MSKYTEYLGDGVYTDFDGYHVIIYTSNGTEISNKISLEPPVFNALVEYRDRIFNLPLLDEES